MVRDKVLSNLPGWKDNPNNFEIINKWNRRIYQKHKYKLFHELEPIICHAIDVAFADCPMNPNFETFVDVRDVNVDKSYQSNKYSALHFNPEVKYDTSKTE